MQAPSGKHRSILISILLLFGALLYLLNYEVLREDAWQVVSLYSGLFLLFFAYLRSAPDNTWIRMGTWAGIGFRLLILFSIPNLSDDFYRFIWDGRLLAAEQDPFLHLPSWYFEHCGFADPTALTPLGANLYSHGVTPELFELLNSKEYYTVYPPILQTGFGIAGVLSPDSILHSVWVLKGLIFLTEVISILLISPILRMLKLPSRSVLVYALNPLVIIELTGNIHFEAVMVLGLLIAIWLLLKGKHLWATTGIALAAGAKILPVMFFPFLIKRLGWKKAIPFFLLAGIQILLLFELILSPEKLANFSDSLRLYFGKFEYNASIFYLLSKPLSGTGANLFFSKLFPLVILFSISWWAIREKEPKMEKLPEWMLFSLTIYYLLATTVHPWYLTTFVALSALTRYRYAVVWSALIPLTYLSYWNNAYEEWWSVIILEYMVVFGWMLYELGLKRRGLTLEDWAYSNAFVRSWIKKSIPGRVAIKLDPIHRLIPEGSSVLDIGCGNGGLSNALMRKGIDITSVDVKDISFFDDVKPVIYDGQKLPYQDNSFDVALIITVLHHTPDPVIILKEAKRVAKRVIVMEDIYSNAFQKHLTFFTDSLVNLEFEGHPHTNKTDKEWRETFEQLNLKVRSAKDFRTLLFFRQIIYNLERK